MLSNPSNRDNAARRNNASRGVDVRAMRGRNAKNKDQVKSEKDASYSAPGARVDTNGSEHNQDARRKSKEKLADHATGRPDLAAREEGQDTRKAKSREHLNKQAAEGHKPRRGQKHTANDK